MRAHRLWHRHPGVRTGTDLTRGERAADIMRNSMGSWNFVFGSLLFLAGWIAAAETGAPIDNPQLTILNLVLSCVAALQGAILLIAAKRADQVSAELARHDFETDTATNKAVQQLAAELAAVRTHLGVPPHDQP
ncbi:MAG: DUF1003 domain-containing protein [Streptomyces sp.]|nr:DUF1003 domain-containing protein [Streptomyces sp.]